MAPWANGSIGAANSSTPWAGAGRPWPMTWGGTANPPPTRPIPSAATAATCDSSLLMAERPPQQLNQVLDSWLGERQLHLPASTPQWGQR
jgi:hypothetical protein